MAQIHNDNSAWQKYTLDKLGDYFNGRAFKKHEWKKEGLPIIRIQNLNDITANFNYTNKVHEPRYKVENGDLLVSWAASLGVYLWDRGDAWLNQHIFKVIPNEKLVTKDFLYYLFKSVLSALYLKTHGTGMVHITKGDFDSHEVSIPDLPEQELIVKKLNIALPLVNASHDNIVLAKTKLNQFRQAVLSAAITGKLTKDWRENRNKGELNNILELINENLNKSNIASKKTRKHSKVVFETHEFENEIDLPDNWVLENLGNISEHVTDGEHATPRRVENGVYLLSARNVQNGYLSFEKVDYIPEDEYERIIKRCNPQEGDILISCSGSVGRVCIVPKDVRFTLVRSVALVKLQANKFLSDYLELYLQSYLAQNQILKLQKATAQANLFIGQIKKIVIVLPPLEEQQEIVRKVHHYFSIASQVEKQIKNSEAWVSKLTQAILAKTFNN